MPEITPTVLYKHMKKFVEKDDVRPVFKHIWFDGEHAVATNTHVLCAVKFQAEPHFETVEGAPAKLDTKFPDWKRVVLEEDGFDVQFTISENMMDYLPEWVRLFKFIVQATKVRGAKSQYHIVCISRQRDELFLYFFMAESGAPVKVKWLVGLPEKQDFQLFVNAEYILNTLAFIQDTNADHIDWVFDKPERAGRMELRTEDMRVTISPTLVRKDSTDPKVRRFLAYIDADKLKQSEAEDDDDDDDDLSFLD